MIEFRTNRPNALLQAFRDAIKAGRITTWKEVAGGEFGHLAAQWKDQGSLAVLVEPRVSLDFYFVAGKGDKDPREVYAYLHSKMLDTFISHFPNMFTVSSVTPSPVEGEGEVN
ncbi:hypothetical protein [Methylobacterium sp. Leaf88]|uniref:hypothetical protein n=1 Tax=Methylobacterium sp. Leaf88 TaxID=1736244 RepID=UPI000B0E5282|nr:hypothetical protein [Methylobacterium sp. Leaf88]